MWLLDPEESDAERVAWCLHVLSAEESARQKRLLRSADRELFALAHGFKRAVLSRYGTVAAGEWRFAEGAEGRPEITHPAAPEGLRFNISHTRGLIAVLLHGERDAGVDVERLGRVDDTASLSRRFFTAEERDALLALPPPERELLFYRYWTLKEAYVKARGLGLALNLKKIWFDVGNPSRVAIHCSDDLDDDASDWTFQTWEIGNRHVLAAAARLAASGRARSIRILHAAAPTSAREERDQSATASGVSKP